MNLLRQLAPLTARGFHRFWIMLLAFLTLGGTVQAQNLQPAPHWLNLVNAARYKAGVLSVNADEHLSAQCWEHARYMAENDHLTHMQDMQRPYASAGGDHCAHFGNVWLGPAYSQSYWKIEHTIETWLASPGHRLWMLYPTTPVFGYGFYTAPNNRTGAALDVISRVQFANDIRYRGWPLRYPADGQGNVPPGRYPITLNWRYLGPQPTVSKVMLTTSDGRPIPADVTTELPAGHKGVLVIPLADISAGTKIIVRIFGTYDTVAFSSSWSYTVDDEE